MGPVMITTARVDPQSARACRASEIELWTVAATTVAVAPTTTCLTARRRARDVPRYLNLRCLHREVISDGSGSRLESEPDICEQFLRWRPLGGDRKQVESGFGDKDRVLELC